MKNNAAELNGNWSLIFPIAAKVDPVI